MVMAAPCMAIRSGVSRIASASMHYRGDRRLQGLQGLQCSRKQVRGTKSWAVIPPRPSLGGLVRFLRGKKPQRMATNDALVWIDCEMTGLDPDRDEIIEIFCIITTGHLELVDEAGWGRVVQSKGRIHEMDEWCTRTHGKSGLTASVVASEVTPDQAAEELLAYIKKHVPQRGAVLAGNSVHCDRAFLSKEPYNRVIDYLHHRILDVSSLKEAARRWSHRDVSLNAPRKQTLHRARDDILESISEARYYKELLFGGGPAGKGKDDFSDGGAKPFVGPATGHVP